MGVRRCDLRGHGGDEVVELVAGVFGASVCICGLANHVALCGDCGTWALVSYGGCLRSCADCDYLGLGEVDEGAMALGSMEQTVEEPRQSYHGAEGGVLIGGFAAGAVTLANFYTLTLVATKTVSENADSLDGAPIPNTKRLQHYRGRERIKALSAVLSGETRHQAYQRYLVQ